jgi:hypothetical protein
MRLANVRPVAVRREARSPEHFVADDFDGSAKRFAAARAPG